MREGRVLTFNSKRDDQDIEIAKLSNRIENLVKRTETQQRIIDSDKSHIKSLEAIIKQKSEYIQHKSEQIQRLKNDIASLIPLAQSQLTHLSNINEYRSIQQRKIESNTESMQQIKSTQEPVNLLSDYLGKRILVTATYQRMGTIRRFTPAKTLATLLLLNVKLDNKILTNHTWVMSCKSLINLELKEGDELEFEALVREYKRTDESIGYELSRPSKVKKL